MAGHSKWSTIKRKKGAADQKRGKIFTRLIHEITTAVREGKSGDPDANPRLRLAIDKAKSANMPNANIERAIRRATGEEQGEEQFELSYEGYGPGGAAVLVEVVTDNKNRTVSEVRHAFSKSGGSLGENGCVAWMFEKKGLFTLKKENLEEERVMEAGLDAGAEDITDEGDVWEIVCAPHSFVAVQQALQPLGGLELAELQMLPSNRVSLEGKDAEKMIKLLEMLDDIDDVVNVSFNCDFPEPEGAA